MRAAKRGRLALSSGNGASSPAYPVSSHFADERWFAGCTLEAVRSPPNAAWSDRTNVESAPRVEKMRCPPMYAKSGNAWRTDQGHQFATPRSEVKPCDHGVKVACCMRCIRANTGRFRGKLCGRAGLTTSRNPRQIVHAVDCRKRRRRHGR